MKAQWQLQRKIVARYRELGIVGQLPGFQGNVPAALKALHKDSNITIAGDTGWMDSLDPLYAEVADAWMAQLIADFGTCVSRLASRARARPTQAGAARECKAYLCPLGCRVASR